MVTEPAVSEEVGCPPVRVRRRHNRPLAAWRRNRAVELATAGHSYEAIAREVGYTNRGTAYRAVHDSLQQQARESVERYRRQQLDRLEELQAAIWPQAMGGDPEAVLAAHRIVLSQCRLLGLLASPAHKERKFGPATVVLTADELRHYREAHPEQN
jgi:hypothetical protein